MLTAVFSSQPSTNDLYWLLKCHHLLVYSNAIREDGVTKRGKKQCKMKNRTPLQCLGECSCAGFDFSANFDCMKD